VGEVVQAVRCLQCGETRWSLFQGSVERLLERPCEICGGETAVERRRPGRRTGTHGVERRAGSRPRLRPLS
jgi:translation initiation factor 2 beta subunit (eIF-2beta)/eIF-5